MSWLTSTQCFTENTEWALNTDAFLLLPNVFFQPEIDLFASVPSIIRFPHTFPGYPIQMCMQLMLLLFPGQTYNFMLFLLLASFHKSWRGLSLTVPQVSWSSPNGQPNCGFLKCWTYSSNTLGGLLHARSTSHSASTPHVPFPLQETLPPGSSFVGEALCGFSLLSTTATLIEESWRPGTRVQYDSLLWGWTRFCSSRQVNPMSPTIYDTLAYLTSMFERGLPYHTISAAKSVLSGVLHVPGVTAISEHTLIIHLLKGIFHVRPPQLHYELIWDTDLVLSYLKNLCSSPYCLKFLSETCYPVKHCYLGSVLALSNSFAFPTCKLLPLLLSLIYLVY